MISSIFEEDCADSARFNSSTVTHQLTKCRKKCQLATTICKNKCIITLPLAVLGILCAIGLVLIFTIIKSVESNIRNDASLLAIQTGQYFDHKFHQTLLPLFSLAQFVEEIDSFQSLAGRIGPAFGKDSLPLIPKGDGIPSTHRNVTGVCNEPDLLKRFTKIAAQIKRNSNLEKILVNLQLAPHGVVCMLHPVNNTEDFEPPIFMDNSGAVGHDLMTDPRRSFVAKETVKAEDVTVAGPLKLIQCDGCHPTVERAFIARLPIVSDSHVMIVDGEVYNRWGFAVALINWDALVDSSNVFEHFEERGYEFQLTRTDHIFNKDTKVYDQKKVVLVESANFVSDKYVVSTPLETTDEEWVITVSYSGCKWMPWAIFACVVVSICFASLFAVILCQKQLHLDLQEEKNSLLLDQAKQVARRERERELNEYISHEVRNPLSAAISACNFISATVQELKPKCPEDLERKNNIAEDVSIVESSLKFINDILRSILDIHKSASNQMTLNNASVDILKDILEPVASMLYNHDSTFEIILDCPDGLVVHSDRLRLKQVILNLGRNAAKFVQTGFIKFRAETSSQGTVCISVEDSGSGIPPSMRPHMFCKFKSSLDVTGQGTGLGLSLCKSLVSLMNGDIYLDQNYDSGLPQHPGTRIVVDLKQYPMVASSHHDTEVGDILETESDAIKGVFYKTSSDTTRSTEIVDVDECTQSQETSDSASTKIIALPGKMSVLIVDDDRILRKLAARSIKKIRPNWEIQEAASGETALQLTDTMSFDIIFMDQYMTSVEQSLKGTETTRALRAKNVTSLICGLSANDIEGCFLRAGADAFLLKPFPCKRDELIAALSMVVSSKRMNRLITFDQNDEDEISRALHDSHEFADNPILSFEDEGAHPMPEEQV